MPTELEQIPRPHDGRTEMACDEDHDGLQRADLPHGERAEREAARDRHRVEPEDAHALREPEEAGDLPPLAAGKHEGVALREALAVVDVELRIEPGLLRRDLVRDEHPGGRE